jgi:23S rRNA pseudouridine1911/1915/1917 synthase
MKLALPFLTRHDDVKCIMPVQNIVVQSSDAGDRVDTFLAKKTGITRSQIQKFIISGAVSVNGSTVTRNYRLKMNDAIAFCVAEKEEERLVPEPIPVEILYRDEHVIVVNKPAGLVVYPAAGHSHGTLMNALAYHCENLAAIGGPLRPGVVHRLDKDTSGVMVIALSDRAYYALTSQFRERTINRRYKALIYGNLKEDEGEISLRIGRSSSDRKKMSTRGKSGKEARTKWKVLKRLGGSTLIEVKLGTGRTHQIRVHFASVGHPVLGDRTYGKKVEVEMEVEKEKRKKKKIFFPRQMLHAESLGFIHPATGEYLEFTSPLPEDMAQKIEELGGI